MRRTALSLLTAAVLAGACGFGEPIAPARFDPQAYVEGILDLMERSSVRRLEIDWPTLRAQVMGEAEGAASLQELHPAITLALTLLGDGHSSFTSRAGTVLRVRTRSCTDASIAPPELPASIGYVRVPRFSGTPDDALGYADGMQAAVQALDREDLAGWIVDLRDNGGGNMWPMLAGIGPILGPGTAGYFVDPSGARTPWEYRDGGAWSGGSLVQRVTSAYVPEAGSPRVAVLTDGGVASSGEAIAISFRGRPDTRSFGTATCGLSTSNRAFPLVDGSVLNLAVATMADRTGRPYGDVVVPDEVVEGDPVARAVAWLL